MSFAEKFEGLDQHHNWSSPDWDELKVQLDANLLNVMSPRARLLYVSQQLRGPLADLKAIADGKQPPLKYRLYSAHDDNIANWLVQLNPSFKWLGINYASQIKVEVYQEKATQRLKVQMVYNGKTLKLEKCRRTLCTMKEFTTQMETYSLASSDLPEACAAKPDPFPRAGEEKFLN